MILKNKIKSKFPYNNKLLGVFVLILAFLPLSVLAASANCSSVKSGSIQEIVCGIGNILSVVIPVLVVFGVLLFIWGIVQYVIGDSEEAKKKGKDRIIFGLIGFVVIFSLWGLVAIVITTFEVDQQTTIVSNFIEYNKVITSDQNFSCSLISTRYTDTNTVTLGSLMNYAACVISNSVIPLIVILTVMMFVWGVVQYVINDTEEAKTKGRNFMIWGIIGLAVMVGVWGLVSIVGNTFNIDPTIPQLKSQP